MGKKSFTVMVIPNQSSRTFTFSLGSGLIRTVILLSVVFVGCSSWLGYSYYVNRGLAAEYQTTAGENASMRSEVLSLVERLKTVQNGINRVNEFYGKVKTWSDVQLAPEKQDGIGPVSSEEYNLSQGGHRKIDTDIVPRAINRDSLIFKNVFDQLDHIDDEAAHQVLNMQNLISSLGEREDMLATRPSLNPTKGWLTSGFGMRTSPFTGRRSFHAGLDIAASSGTPVISPADGIVIFTGRKGGYGNVVSLDHGNGTVTLYAHTSEIFVRVGQRIRRGDHIAAVGNTGRSTGPHLHYEVSVNGIIVDPRKYILND